MRKFEAQFLDPAEICANFSEPQKNRISWRQVVLAAAYYRFIISSPSLSLSLSLSISPTHKHMLSLSHSQYSLPITHTLSHYLTPSRLLHQRLFKLHRQVLLKI